MSRKRKKLRITFIPNRMKKSLDIAVISDVHLGNYACCATELLTYLKSIEPKTLILNGDFIDIWNFRKFDFPKAHINVLRYVLKMSNRGTKVYYITGNNDDALRRYSDFDSGNIHLRDKLVLQLKGKRYWFFHGDIFDTLTQYSPSVTKLGGKGYDLLITINRFVNKWRQRFGKPRISVSKSIKKNVKKAGKYITDFEQTALRLAARENYDYVVCGHIHFPRIRIQQIGEKNVTYMNSGDWTENLTALEYSHGKWRIYEYDPADFVAVNKKLHVENTDIPSESLDSEAVLSAMVGRSTLDWLKNRNKSKKRINL